MQIIDGKQVASQAVSYTHLALGVLLHDVGKPPCRQVDETGRIRFSGHDKEGASMARDILRRLK